MAAVEPLQAHVFRPEALGEETVRLAHAVAHARKIAPLMGKEQIIVINLSGRGDKDCAAIARYRGEDIHE